MNNTIKEFEDILNKKSPSQGHDKWIIAGKLRMAYMVNKKYGTALKMHDPIQFDVLFQEWKRKQK